MLKDLNMNPNLVPETYSKKLTIGMPVYNGESHIRQALDSLLNQTFADFELIISDNASNDSTSMICQEYTRKDNRIRYFRQTKNIHAYPNFYFVLQEANSKYFMWAAADDIWEPSFIDKNIGILESNENIVGSISEVDKFNSNYSKRKKNDSSITQFRKYMFVHPVSGSYEKKMAFCLKFRQATMIYAIYRTEELKKSIHTNHLLLDLAIILNIVKYGDIHVIDEVLMHRSPSSKSTKTFVQALRSLNFSYFEILFMYVPFLSWCRKELGLKFIIKNISSLVYLHYLGYGNLALSIMQLIKTKIKKSTKLSL